MGRAFLPDEDSAGRDNIALISHRLRQRRFNSDAQLIGKAITVNGRSRTIVGVMPHDFYFPDAGGVEIWIPAVLSHNNRGGHYLQAIGRLKKGVTIEQAQAEANDIAQRLEQAYPESNAGVGVHLVSFREELVGDIKPALLVLLGAVAFVLLIACANVANRLLAGAAGRQNEVAVRTALGASRGRLIRQLLTDSVLLASIGGGLGLLLAVWGVSSLLALNVSDLPRSQAISIDGQVLAFTLGVTLFTGLIFGLAPALQPSRLNLTEALKAGGRGNPAGQGQSRTRSLLVIVEVALSLVLLVGAGLMFRSFWRLQHVNVGFKPDNLLTFGLSLPSARYPFGENGEPVTAFYQQVVDRVKTLPGVEAAGVTAWLPINGAVANRRFTLEGRPIPQPGSEPTAGYNIVNSDYFRAIGIALLKGRALIEQDNRTSPLVMIISEAAARKFWPDEDPIGKRVSYYEGGGTRRWREIVGIVKDMRHNSLRSEPKPEMYVPHLQMPTSSMSLLVRTAGEPLNVVAAVRGQIRLVDKDLPLYDIKPMTQVLSAAVARDRFNLLLLGIFASVALILATVGLYGVMSYTVTQNTREIGIRMALGAQQQQILKLVLGQALVLTLVGVVIGLAAAWALTRVMSNLLFSVTATDPLTFIGASFLLIAVAPLACYLPARRATKVDPIVALRYE